MIDRADTSLHLVVDALQLFMEKVVVQGVVPYMPRYAHENNAIESDVCRMRIFRRQAMDLFRRLMIAHQHHGLRRRDAASDICGQAATLIAGAGLEGR
jgi:hypothetical protein